MNTTVDLGFSKPPGATRVVVAMSGGVDSSVVAAMLHHAGYDVVGITMQLYDHGAAVGRKGACCAGIDIHDARRIAAECGFPHYVLDYESHFRTSVIDAFVDSYASGSTPIPCIRCNERVKFTELLDMAKDLEADCLATGHYVRRLEAAEGAELHQAVDTNRDQSYFLFATTRAQLEYLRFPLGGVPSKKETRALAERFGLLVADKPDSQDICFVPDGNYAALIRKLNPAAAEPGDIVDLSGNKLGEHTGIINYTIGQRRRLGLESGATPLHVIKLDPANRTVTVGPRSALMTRQFRIEDINWLGHQPFEDGASWTVTIKVRSSAGTVAARIEPDGKRAGIVYPTDAIWGVTPGQACVFYEPASSRVLGGGWIVREATDGL